MKNKLKKIIFSIAMVFALSMGSLCGLLTGVINFGTSSAEYKPTSVTSSSKPFEANAESEWSMNYFNDDVKNAFSDSKRDLTLKNFEDYTLNKNYAGEDLSDSEKVLAMIAKDAPLSAVVDKKDDDGNYVYEMIDSETYKYEEDPENPGHAKEYTEEEKNNSSEKVDFVQDKDDATVFYKRIREKETKNTYYFFKTSSSIKLTQNSFYVVSAYVYTHNAVAAISVADSNRKLSGTFTEIQSESDAWKQVWLFFETEAGSDLTSYLYLYYGSNESLAPGSTNDETSGFVLFDHIDIQKISKTEYMMQTIDGKTASESSAVSLKTSLRKEYSLDGVSNLDPHFSQDNISLYEHMFSENDYVKNQADLKYQYYVPKFAEDNASTLLSERKLKEYRDAYASQLQFSIVSEFDDIKTTVKAENEEDEDTILQFSTFNQNNKALKVVNSNEKYELGLLTPSITIKQFATYRFSIWVKATDANAEAIVKAISFVPTGNNSDGALQITTQTVTAFSKSNDITNNWTEVVFYVQSNPLHDCQIQFALLAGKGDTVYFDEMRLEAVTTGTYSSASSSTKIDLGSTGSSTSSSGLIEENVIKNGGFNEITTSENQLIENLEKPYAPDGWTKLDSNSKDVVSGIISSENDAFNDVKDKIGATTNPVSVPFHVNGYEQYFSYNPNLLVIYSSEKKSFGYKNSSSFSLDSSSVYQISFWTFAENSNFDGEIYANLSIDDDNVSEIKEDFDGIKGQWVKHTIVVKTGSTSRSLKFTIGTKDSKGTVYFHNFKAIKLSEITVGTNKVSVDDQFAGMLKKNNTFDKQTTNKTCFVDFTANGALMHSPDKVKDKDYYDSLFYQKETLKENDEIVQGEFGVVDTTKLLTLETDPEFKLESSFLKRTNAKSDFALLLYNKTSAETKIEPLENNSLTSSSYYRISFWVKTANIPEGKGLTATMSAISAEFTNINTGAVDSDSNEYKLFTVLVKTGKSSISNFEIDFSLGEKNNNISGLALISDIDVYKFSTESDYTKEVEAVDKNDKNTIIKDFSDSASSDSSSTDETADSLTLATFFLVFSSILLVIALVIAIVAISIKKLPKSKTVVGTNNADVSKDKKTDPSSKDGFV